MLHIVPACFCSLEHTADFVWVCRPHQHFSYEIT